MLLLLLIKIHYNFGNLNSYHSTENKVMSTHVFAMKDSRWATRTCLPWRASSNYN